MWERGGSGVQCSASSRAWGRVRLSFSGPLTLLFEASDSPVWGLWQGTVLVPGEERHFLVRLSFLGPPSSSQPVSWFCAALGLPSNAPKGRHEAAL